MNDITYRPFIRDSALGDINIQIPNLEIPVYKPRYSQPLEDDTETEVQSQVEEIRNPEPIVQETTVHKFNSKKDFKDTMLPIYERLLKSKGLNPAFAKSLVAQDGLESAWGSKPAGSYNFGGIKGKGTTKRTREVINGKDIYINDQFRNFKSLEDYANFKIDLLNNKRYNAFSGDIKEFANRVHRGGYTTDPRYANILNQVIASAKHGGVLKFQQGGIQEGKQWLEDWYKSRKGLVKQNVKQVLPIPLPVTESLVFNALKRNLDLTRAKINPSKVPDNASGVYYPFGRRIFLTDGSTSTAIHEWTHSSLPDAQEKVIKKYQDNFGDTVYDNKTIVPDEYLDNPQEIYARLMQLRYSINADPNHKFTKEEIQNIKKEHLDHYTLTNRLKNSEGKGSFSVSQFDKDGKIIQSEPFNPEYKIVPEESTVTPHYNKENTYNLLNRYSDDFLLYLFNNVAQAPTKKKDTTLYAQLGLKIPKYQNPSKPIELPPLNSEGIVGNSNVIKDQRINKLIKDVSLWNTNNDLSKLEFRDSLMTNPTKALDFYNEYKTARQKGDIETLYNSGKTWYEPIMVRNSNYEWAKIVTDNFKGNDSQINAVLANTYTETQGWTRLKQNKKGPAKGIMMFEPKALELYNKWLNGREDSIALQVQYVSELFNEKNKILKTPWDRATEKDKQKALNTSEKDIDKLKDWERSIFMHKGYTTEQAWQDWESGDLTRATKAFEALFLRAGKPNLNKRIRAGEAINKYWYGKQ